MALVNRSSVSTNSSDVRVYHLAAISTLSIKRKGSQNEILLNTRSSRKTQDTESCFQRDRLVEHIDTGQNDNDWRHYIISMSLVHMLLIERLPTAERQ